MSKTIGERLTKRQLRMIDCFYSLLKALVTIVGLAAVVI